MAGVVVGSVVSAAVRQCGDGKWKKKIIINVFLPVLLFFFFPSRDLMSHSDQGCQEGWHSPPRLKTKRSEAHNLDSLGQKWASFYINSPRGRNGNPDSEKAVCCLCCLPT